MTDANKILTDAIQEARRRERLLLADVIEHAVNNPEQLRQLVQNLRGGR